MCGSKKFFCFQQRKKWGSFKKSKSSINVSYQDVISVLLSASSEPVWRNILNHAKLRIHTIHFFGKHKSKLGTDVQHSKHSRILCMSWESQHHDWVNLWNKPGGEALSIIEREVCILPFSASPNYCQLGCKGNHPLKNDFEKLIQSSTEGESSCWGFLAGGTFFSERLVFSSRLSENKNLNFQLEKENNIGLALIKT